MPKAIPGLKVIRLNSSGINLPDDPSLPFKLDATFRPPSFMTMAFMGVVGGSEVPVVRSTTKEALDQLISENDYRTHPRLLQLTITGPDGVLEKIPR